MAATCSWHQNRRYEATSTKGDSLLKTIVGIYVAQSNHEPVFLSSGGCEKRTSSIHSIAICPVPLDLASKDLYD